MKKIKDEFIDSVYELLNKHIHRLKLCHITAEYVTDNMPKCCTCALITERLTNGAPIVIYGKKVKVIQAKYMKETWKSNDFIILNFKNMTVTYNNISIIDIDDIKETRD